MATTKKSHGGRQQRPTKPQRSPQKDRGNLTRGLNSARLASLLNQRVPMINAVIERKEKAQVITQEVMLLEFNY
jgi:hypothetical protein